MSNNPMNKFMQDSSSLEFKGYMGDCKKHLSCLVSLFCWIAITVAITFDL